MKKISRIKLLFASLPIVVIALLLFIRWIDYGKSYKSLANWETQNVGFSEFSFYCNRLNYITKNWQTAGNNQNDNINKYLHIDMEQSAVWFEDNGNIKKENYFKLPERNSWKLSILSSPSITLPKHLILRTKRYNEIFSGRFDLSTNTNNPPYHYFFDPTSSAGFFGSMTGTFAIIAAPNDISSLFVSQEEYTKYKNSQVEINSEQGNENDNIASQTLEENKSKWFDIEKYLYQEIAGQIIKAGYSLPFNSIEIEAGSDYTGGHATIIAYGESILNKYLNTDWGNKTVRAYFKIDYLGDDIWYARTAPHPKQKLESDRELNLEFLIFADEQIPRSKYKRYMMQGRKVQQLESYLYSKWKTSLPNSLNIEIIGINSDNEPDTWWGPDGSALKFPEYVKIEPLNKFKDITFIAWQIKLPERREGKQLIFEFDSAKDIQTITIPDRYGNYENVMITVFDNSQKKTDFKIIIRDNDNVTQFTAFKNISLVKGKNEGFIIEY